MTTLKPNKHINTSFTALPWQRYRDYLHIEAGSLVRGNCLCEPLITMLITPCTCTSRSLQRAIRTSPVMPGLQPHMGSFRAADSLVFTRVDCCVNIPYTLGESRHPACRHGRPDHAHTRSGTRTHNSASSYIQYYKLCN